MSGEYSFLETTKKPMKCSKERWDNIFNKELVELKNKKVRSNNGEAIYTTEYVEWLESLIGDVRINKEWK